MSRENIIRLMFVDLIEERGRDLDASDVPRDNFRAFHHAAE
jgi:hypothetical protein